MPTALRRQSLLIFSRDRIFSHLLAGLLRDHFSISMAHDPGAMTKLLGKEEALLLLADGALLEPSVVAALQASRSTHRGFPHVLLFVSPAELQSLEARYKPIVDKTLLKPTGTEDILAAVLQITVDER